MPQTSASSKVHQPPRRQLNTSQGVRAQLGKPVPTRAAWLEQCSLQVPLQPEAAVARAEHRRGQSTTGVTEATRPGQGPRDRRTAQQTCSEEMRDGLKRPQGEPAEKAVAGNPEQQRLPVRVAGYSFQRKDDKRTVKNVPCYLWLLCPIQPYPERMHGRVFPAAPKAILAANRQSERLPHRVSPGPCPRAPRLLRPEPGTVTSSRRSSAGPGAGPFPNPRTRRRAPPPETRLGVS